MHTDISGMTRGFRRRTFCSDLTVLKPMKHSIYISVFSLILFLLPAYRSAACTAAVISGKATPDGRPLLWKHRDTGILDNRLEFFRGDRYCFTGLVNSGGNIASGASSSDREVWIGANTAGFAIMNTASYNIKDDTLPRSLMDREGILIFRALGICGNISDFEHFLDTLRRPFGVEANFGVIDSDGGAAMYEVNNRSYRKYDVNDPSVAPEGYMVFTNFSFSGRKDDIMGYERYLTASAIFREADERNSDFTPEFLFDSLSRSFRNEFLGIDYTVDYERMVGEGMCNGIVPDSDFIPRRSTSASVAVKGVTSGEDPFRTVIWTVLGYPPCGVAIPVPLADEDHIPYYMKSPLPSGKAEMCSLSLYIKNRYVFRFDISNGAGYLDIGQLLSGEDGRPPVLSCCRNAEEEIRKVFNGLYDEYLAGNISRELYLDRYDALSRGFLDTYINNISCFLPE